MVLVQKWPFLGLFFLRWYGPGICLLRYSRTKNVFLDYKNKKFKKSKNWHFSKAINPWFWSKNGHFSNINFRQYRAGEFLLRHYRTKNRLTRLEQQEIQKVDKFTFFQGGLPMVLVQKWPFLQLFFFRQYRPGKCLSRYSRTKKCLSRL